MKLVRASNLEADVDALFSLPLAEFTGARNALAARLKKSGRGDEKEEAARVKALAKPSISAWAVNQLYWNHREAFDQLIAFADRFHKAQASRGGGKIADMRTALDARREALTYLSDLATSLLREAGPNPGQNPSPDTIHRITTTLEGISAYSSRRDGPRAGRLTHDVDPPGFESLASFVPGMRSIPTAVAGGSTSAKRKQAYPPAMLRTLSLPSPKRRGIAGGTDLTTTKTRRKEAESGDVRQKEEARKARISDAKVSLQDAKRSLTEARAKAQSLEAAQKKADIEAKKIEKQWREAEEELRKAKAASEDAARRARSAAVEVAETASAVEDAELTVEEASKELESLLRESSGS
jgi:hypothetical protein